MTGVQTCALPIFAPLPEEDDRIKMDKIDESYIEQVISKIESSNWKDSDTVGEEKRKELPKSDQMYGETIFSDEDIVHIMCSFH